jgi:hypothetical protein
VAQTASSLLHPAAVSRSTLKPLGNFLAGSRPQLTTAPAALDYCLLACTITLPRRARAFIVPLVFARFLPPDSCPEVLAFHCKLLYLRALQAIGARAFVTTVLFGLSCVCCWLLLCERSVCNWNSGVCICICERLQGGAVLLAIRGLFKERVGEHGLRHRALWSRPALGRQTSGTGHGDGDNDAGIGISSSFEHHIRTCDQQRRLKLDHAKATFRTTTTT